MSDSDYHKTVTEYYVHHVLDNGDGVILRRGPYETKEEAIKAGLKWRKLWRKQDPVSALEIKTINTYSFLESLL
jgi:hypothetical protein